MARKSDLQVAREYVEAAREAEDWLRSHALRDFCIPRPTSRLVWNRLRAARLAFEKRMILS